VDRDGSIDHRMSHPKEGRPLVRCEKLGYRFGQRVVVPDFDLEIHPGELCYLTGPSASGKTTLLRMLHGQLQRGWGRLLIAGVDVTNSGSRERRRLRARAGFVFQEHRLLDHLTALENVVYELRVADLHVSQRELINTATNTLAEAGLYAEMERYPASCRAANASAWPSPEPWHLAAAWCSLTSPPPARTPPTHRG
jgi:ABC-type transporter Mla maintaining outer membrane lipid asymmetry ATPase subunit MlaF